MKRLARFRLGLIFIGILLFQCSSENQAEEDNLSVYPYKPVSIRDIKLTDEFWLPIVKKVQEKTISFALSKSIEEGRLENFLMAGGKLEGEVKGAMPFDDTDIYKIIEGASNSLLSAPNPKLEAELDSIIAIIKIGQEKDGYLTTWRSINPSKPPAPWVKVDTGGRWEHLEASHELYNAGHLYEAAVVHYLATKKRNFLDIAIKNADLIVRTFGDDPKKIKAVPGHQIIETGLLKLYGITRNEAYKKMARYFLDSRGNPNHHPSFGPYSQDHLPVINQDEVVGHAVRAMYMYAAMTDIATIDQDAEYQKAIQNLWENMVSKKMYITGGIGSRHDGEAFGENYELPNLTGYNETCAAIGSVYWNHRLHLQSGNAKYFDIIERTLYNGLLSGLSLDGTEFFYPNALESDGEFKFNRGQCTRQSWFDCSCCPTNLIRFIPSIPNLLYSVKENDLFVNLYMGNEAKISLNSTRIQISENSRLPWEGTVDLNLNPEKSQEFTLHLRVPYWAENKAVPSDLYHYNEEINSPIKLSINGEKTDFKIVDQYISIKRTWKKGDIIKLDFPMQVRSISANKLVKEDNNKVSLERGPLVYAFEQQDNSLNIDLLKIPLKGNYETQFEANLLNGVNTIKTNGYKAIPYYSWSNRSIGKMKVWAKIN